MEYGYLQSQEDDCLAHRRRQMDEVSTCEMTTVGLQDRLGEAYRSFRHCREQLDILNQDAELSARDSERTTLDLQECNNSPLPETTRIDCLSLYNYCNMETVEKRIEIEAIETEIAKLTAMMDDIHCQIDKYNVNSQVCWDELSNGEGLLAEQQLISENRSTRIAKTTKEVLNLQNSIMAARKYENFRESMQAMTDAMNNFSDLIIFDFEPIAVERLLLLTIQLFDIQAVEFLCIYSNETCQYGESCRLKSSNSTSDDEEWITELMKLGVQSVSIFTKGNWDTMALPAQVFNTDFAATKNNPHFASHIQKITDQLSGIPGDVGKVENELFWFVENYDSEHGKLIPSPIERNFVKTMARILALDDFEIKAEARKLVSCQCPKRQGKPNCSTS